MRHPTRSTFAAIALALAGFGGNASAQDARYLAGNCANCHGTDGRAAGGGGMPALAGLSRGYFIEQMNAFRNGTRQATIMHQLTKGYTDEQIARLADYFASIKTTR